MDGVKGNCLAVLAVLACRAMATAVRVPCGGMCPFVVARLLLRPLTSVAMMVEVAAHSRPPLDHGKADNGATRSNT